MSVEDKINELGIVLPNAAAPVGSYVATKIVGKFLYISGQISIDEKGNLIKGKLGKDLRPDYAIIKHCSDNEDGGLGVDYDGYEKLYPLLKEAEKMSDDEYKCVIKWSKIEDKGNNKRSYQRCYGAPFMLQMSGSGLVAPCGGLFNEKYKKFHIGNICDTRFKDIWKSDRYWEIMNYLSSPKFNAQKMCASLCLQHKVNETLDNYVKGKVKIEKPNSEPPEHINFI